MFYIAICDEDKNIREKERRFFEQYQKDYNIQIHIDEYDNMRRFLHFYAGQYELIMISTKKDGEGIRIARMIRNLDDCVSILFVSETKEYAFDAFQVHPIGYILKGRTYAEFAKEVSDVLNHISRKSRTIPIQTQNEKCYVSIESILYIVYYNHFLEIYMLNGNTYKVKGSLKEFLEKYNDAQILVQIHKNCIVNMIWIERIEKQLIILENVPGTFEISRPKRKYVEETYHNYLARKRRIYAEEHRLSSNNNSWSTKYCET